MVSNANVESISTEADPNRNDKRWGNKSLRKHRSYRVAADGMKHMLSGENEYRDCVDSVSNWTAEKHVKSDEASDGIEIFMNRDDGGMELMHVMGTKPDYHELPLTVESEPTMQVSYIQMKTNYHPACDFNTNHRIQTSSKGFSNKKLTKQEKLIMLGGYQVSDEETATREEIQKNLIEMRNLENERDNINRRLNHDNRLACHKCCIPQCHGESDINSMLDQVKTNNVGNDQNKKSTSGNLLEWDFRRYLQKRRGFCFHASFSNPDYRQTFVKMCGGNKNDKTVHPTLQECGDDPFHVPKVAASAAAVRHLAITKGEYRTSFFISKDDGRYYWDECLPPRLVQRMKDEAKSSTVDGSLRYLACGPNNSYYARLVSGQSFWSICTVDEEFRNVMELFDVQRVAFGSFVAGPSWIVIGQNGKVAWRNLPCRLDMLLSKRTSQMAAPCEISLGEHGSYFIRFMDGEIDYCLPAHISAPCQKILDQGGDITNIALHSESSDAFIIRHTQLA